jgi:hypothetical protein
VTSSYKRKDGTRKRTYECHNRRFSTGLCSAKPIDAERVDAAVIAALDDLIVDFDQWRARLEGGHADERQRMQNEIDRAQADRDTQAARSESVERRWADYVTEGDDAKADLVLPAVQRERDALAAAERRLTATHDALGAVPASAPADAMLDFANALQAAVRGRMDAAGGSLGEVNQALRELFDCFRITETAYCGPVENPDGSEGFVYDHPTRRALLIAPFLRQDVAHAMSDEWPYIVPTDGDAPPLRWLDASDETTLSATRTTPRSTAS